jgi:hypothetical protein
MADPVPENVVNPPEQVAGGSADALEVQLQGGQEYNDALAWDQEGELALTDILEMYGHGEEEEGELASPDPDTMDVDGTGAEARPVRVVIRRPGAIRIPPIARRMPVTEARLFKRLGLVHTGVGMEYGLDMPFASLRMGLHHRGSHWVANADRPPTPGEVVQTMNYDPYPDHQLFAAEGVAGELRDAWKRLYLHAAQSQFLQNKVRAELYPTTDKFDRLLQVSSGRFPTVRSGTDRPKGGDVKAYLPPFEGIPPGISPLHAVRLVHTWVVSAKVAADLQMHAAPEMRRVQWAACAFRDVAAQWFVGEKRRAEVAGAPIVTFARLQKAMLDHFVEGQVHDLVGVDFARKHLKYFATYSKYLDWLLATLELLRSSAPIADAWPDFQVIFHVCNHLKNTSYHENVQEINGERCSTVKQLLARLSARHAVLLGRGE